MRARTSFRLAASVVALLLALLAVLSSSVRDSALALLGDDARNDLVGVYSSLTVRETNTADLARMDNVDVNPFGVNVFLEQEVEEWKVRRTLEMARDAGFHWIKQQVRWTEIEIPGKGQYFDTKNNVADTWAKYDRIVDLARSYGLDLILRLDTSPAWARSIDKEETPPDRLDDYGDFVSAVVTRYKGKVRHYQIWNEPNLAHEWGGEPPNAASYVSLLEISYTRAKQADPDSQIIVAALAPTVEVSKRAVNDLLFLQQMYDAGVGRWFDIGSANPYGLGRGPDDRGLDADDVNFSRPVLIREAMVRNGDAGKPIWASEMGWNALPLDFQGEALWRRVSREQQAQYTVRAYQRMQEEWPWMGVASLWHFRMVHDVNRDQALYYFGIVDNDFTPYPAYTALQQLTAAEPALYPGFHSVDNAAIGFGEGWQRKEESTASGLPLMEPTGAESRLSFTFVGSDLDVVFEAQKPSRLLVKVDGDYYAANRLQRGADGSSYLDLSVNKDNAEQTVAVARGLPWGRHELGVQATDGGGGLAISGFVVGGSPPNVPRTLAWIFVPLVALLVCRLTLAPMAYLAVLLLGWSKSALRAAQPLGRLATYIGAKTLLGSVEGGMRASQQLRRLWPNVGDEPWTGRRGQTALAVAGAFVLLLALALRLLRLDAQSLWYDEGTTAALVQRSIAVITSDSAGDIHPPLYYYVAHFWAAVAGTNEFSLRMLSVLYGVLAVALTFCLGKRMVNQSTALVAAALAAISPALIYYSQEARMYSQLALLAGLSVYLLHKVLDDSSSHRRLLWGAYVAITVAMLYTHYFAATVFLAENLYLAARAFGIGLSPSRGGETRRTLARFVVPWLLTQGLIVGLFIPWLAIAYDQLVGWPAIGAPFGFATLLQRSFRVFAFGVGSEASLTPRRELALLALLALGLAYLLRVLLQRPGRVLLLVLFGVTPLLSMYAMSLQRPAYNPKFLLPVALPFEIALAAGIAGAAGLLVRLASRHFPRTWLARTAVANLGVAIALLAVAVYPAKASLQAYYFDSKYARDDYRGLAVYITENAAASDAVVLNAPGQIEIFDYYYVGSLERYPIPRQRPIDHTATDKDLAAIAASHQGVWLVLWAARESDPDGFVEKWLDSHRTKVLDRPFGNVRLLHYDLGPTTESTAIRESAGMS